MFCVFKAKDSIARWGSSGRFGLAELYKGTAVSTTGFKSLSRVLRCGSSHIFSLCRVSLCINFSVIYYELYESILRAVSLYNLPVCVLLLITANLQVSCLLQLLLLLLLILNTTQYS